MRSPKGKQGSGIRLQLLLGLSVLGGFGILLLYPRSVGSDSAAPSGSPRKHGAVTPLLHSESVADSSSSASVPSSDSKSRQLRTPPKDATGSNGRYRYTLFAHRRTDESNEGITVVTQLTVDRLPSLKAMLTAWKGPVSACVYVSSPDDGKKLADACEDTALFKRHVDFHLLHSNGTAYPVNPLRNVAIAAVKTPWMFLLDADFVPSASMSDFLNVIAKERVQHTQVPGKTESDNGDDVSHLLHRHKQSENEAAAAAEAQDALQRTAYVAPAFSTDLTAAEMPTSKEALIDKVEQKIVVPVNCVWCYGCHLGPTDFRRWYKARKSYKALYDWFYEPYVIVPSATNEDDVPRYDARFIGYGNDKMSHIY